MKLEELVNYYADYYYEGLGLELRFTNLSNLKAMNDSYGAEKLFVIQSCSLLACLEPIVSLQLQPINVSWRW